MQQHILGYQVTASSPEAVVADIVACTLEREGPCRWMACLNPHSYVTAKEDALFRAALRQADWLVPDGVGVVIAGKFLGRSLAGRITGFDIFDGVMAALNARGGRVFFLGSSDETLAAIAKRLAQDYPQVTFAGSWSPPFRPEFTAEDSDSMIAAINCARADVLWVGMSAPKQEKWIARHRDRLDIRFAGAIGAVFDFYTGKIRRSPVIFQRFGLEWLPRLVQEPRRLWRRIGVSAPIFLWDMVRARGGHRPE